MSSLTRLTSLNLVCAPVTALIFLDSSHLLVAQGPFLKLYEVRPKETITKPVTTFRALRSRRIYVLLKHELGDKVRLLVAGGKEVALVDFDHARCPIKNEQFDR